MVFGVIDISVSIENYPLAAPGLFPERIDVTFGISALGEDPFIVAEAVAAYAFAGSVGLKGASGPAELFGFTLG